MVDFLFVINSVLGMFLCIFQLHFGRRVLKVRSGFLHRESHQLRWSPNVQSWVPFGWFAIHYGKFSHSFVYQLAYAFHFISHRFCNVNCAWTEMVIISVEFVMIKWLAWQTVSPGLEVYKCVLEQKDFCKVLLFFWCPVANAIIEWVIWLYTCWQCFVMRYMSGHLPSCIED